MYRLWAGEYVHGQLLALCVILSAVAAAVLRAISVKRLEPHEDVLLDYESIDAARAAVFSNPDRPHQLTVVLRQISSAARLTGGAILGLCLALTSWSGIGIARGAAVFAVAAVCLVAPSVVARRPIVREYARVRGIPVRALRRPGRVRGGAIQLAILGWPTAVALAAMHRVGAQIAVLVIGYLVVDPLLGALLMPLTVRIVAPQVASDAVSLRVQQLAAEAHVKMRRPRIVRSRERRLANALQVGWLPGLKYILIYDYLVDEMSAPQLDAIIAHELAHARLRHVTFRTLISWILITAAALILVDVVSGWQNEIVTLGGFAVVLLAGRYLRSLALRQETAADDFAARIAGPPALASALERLTELNALSANTSAKWDRQVGHPGMAKRIARLRAQELAAMPTVPS